MPCIGMKIDNAVMNHCICEYQSSVMQGIKFLLEKESFTDCTLAAEGKFLNAHKLVLSACSSYFELLFSQQKEKYPIVYLKDVKFENLKALIELIYDGRIQILAKEKDEFLRTVKDLQIKGWKEKESIENIEHLSIPLKNGTEICSDHLSSSPNLERRTEVQSYSIKEATNIQEGKCNFSQSPSELEDFSICASEPQNLVEIPIEDGFLNITQDGVGPKDLCPYNSRITSEINELNDTSKKLSPSHHGSTGIIQNFRKEEGPWCSPVSVMETCNWPGGLLSVQNTDEIHASLLETVFPESTSLTENGSLSDSALDHISFPYESSPTVGHESVRNGQRSTSPNICKDTSLMPHLFCKDDDFHSVGVDLASQPSYQNNPSEQKENLEVYWSSSSSDMDSLCSRSTSGEILQCVKDHELSNMRSNVAAFFENKVSRDHFSEAETCTNKLDEERISDQSSCLSPVLSWHTLYLENGGKPSSFTATSGDNDIFTVCNNEQSSKEDVASLIDVPVPQMVLGQNFPSHSENVTNECGDDAGQKSSLQPTSKRNKVSFTCSALSEKKERHICSVCLLSFHSASKLKKHVRVHKRDAKFTCNVCLCTFVQDSDLSNHVCSTPNETFPCNICTLKFFTKEEHDKHSCCQNQFKSEHCEAKLDSKMEVKIHSKIHVAKGPFKCVACTNVFQKRDDFITHLREYEHCGEGEIGNFTDSYCPLNKLEKRARVWGGDGSFKCHSCNAGFPRRMILKEHIRDHTTEKVLNCQKCDLVFQEKNVLYRHILVNSSGKPFRCQICFAKFSLKKDHATHYQIHLGNKKNHVIKKINKE